MALQDSDSIFTYHRDMIARHGADSSFALGWRDSESQFIRFQALSEIADMNGQTVLDAGCGYGDLFGFLSAKYPQLRGYCGVEQIPELFDEAVTRHEHQPHVSFVSGNFISRKLPVMDYVMASGSLNYYHSDPDFIFYAIKKLFESCTKGMAFNLLRQIASTGLLVAYDPDIIQEYCKTLSDDVRIRDDYAEEDYTILMYK